MISFAPSPKQYDRTFKPKVTFEMKLQQCKLANKLYSEVIYTHSKVTEIKQYLFNILLI